jgi:tRNA(Ile)-lysidine synthase
VRRTALTIAVDKALRAARHPRAGATVVVGLSGGADSVALVDVLSALASARGFRVVAAHLDHGLRAGSAADAAFCAELCERVGVAFETARADVKARARREKGGTEEAARDERYAFLREVKQRHGATVIAVAHTLDDQAETFLLRLAARVGQRGPGGHAAALGRRHPTDARGHAV